MATSNAVEVGNPKAQFSVSQWGMLNEVAMGVVMLLLGFFLAAFSSLNIYSSLTQNFQRGIGSLLMPAGLTLFGILMFVAAIYLLYTLLGPNAVTQVTLYDESLVFFRRNQTSQHWRFSELSGVKVTERELKGGPGMAGLVSGAIMKSVASERDKAESYEVMDKAGNVILSINGRFQNWHDLGEVLLSKVGKKS